MQVNEKIINDIITEIKTEIDKETMDIEEKKNEIGNKLQTNKNDIRNIFKTKINLFKDASKKNSTNFENILHKLQKKAEQGNNFTGGRYRQSHPRPRFCPRFRPNCPRRFTLRKGTRTNGRRRSSNIYRKGRTTFLSRKVKKRF